MGDASYSDGSSSSRSTFPPENELDEFVLLRLLDTLQGKLLARRKRKTTLVVHGGAVEVLALRCRRYTSDVDYIERTLPEELKSGPNSGWLAMLKNLLGFRRASQDTRPIIRDCIYATAVEFNDNPKRPFDLYYDWMNPGADILLPWRLDEECNMYDPLVSSAISDREEGLDIIFDSPGLRLIGITSSWTFALKLQRFSDADETNLVQFLQEDGACAVHTEKEFVQMVEKRLRLDCRELDYGLWTEEEMMEWRTKLMRCVKKARFLGKPRPVI